MPLCMMSGGSPREPWAGVPTMYPCQWDTPSTPPPLPLVPAGEAALPEHGDSFFLLPSWPPGLHVLATPQCLHLKHQFRLWRNTGEKRLPYQDKGQPAGKRASGEQKQSLSSTHCIPRAAPGVWQRNILANTSWLAECYSSP